MPGSVTVPSRIPRPSEIRCVPLTSDGWLKFLREPHSSPPKKTDYFSLPFALQVRTLEVRDGRDYVEVLEGSNAGQIASVSRKSRSESFLMQAIQPSAAAAVRFSVSQQSLTCGGKGPFSAFSGAFDYGADHFTAIPEGHYAIEIPDNPHPTRRGYHRFTRFPEIWFHISGFKDRYIHFGELSEGCVTVRGFLYDPDTDSASGGALPPDCHDFKTKPAIVPGFLGLPYPNDMPKNMAAWDDLCLYLLRCRADDQSLGTLFVMK